MSDSHDRASEPGVADYEPGDAQAEAIQESDPDSGGAPAPGEPPAAGTSGSPATGADELAPGRGVADPDEEPAEPNEPA